MCWFGAQFELKTVVLFGIFVETKIFQDSIINKVQKKSTYLKYVSFNTSMNLFTFF